MFGKTYINGPYKNSIQDIYSLVHEFFHYSIISQNQNNTTSQVEAFSMKLTYIILNTNRN